MTRQEATTDALPPEPAQMWQHPTEVERWLAGQGERVSPPINLRRVGIGQSNITTLLSDADGNEWVMREPPPGTANATAHDVEREARILRSLASSVIPVPRIVGTGRGPAGSAFVVMEKVDGAALENEDDARRLPPARRRELGVSVAATLGSMHRLPPQILDIRTSTTPYVERQLRRVAEAWHLHGTDSIHDGEWQTLLGHLASRRPAAAPPVIMHGDFRLSNLLILDGTIRAVLDWELCTIGDPLADLAWLLDDWRPPEEAEIVMPSPTRAGGFPDRDEMVRIYQELTGFDVGALDYYRAFSQWRAASLLRGVLVRRRAGMMGSHAAVPLDKLDYSIAVLLASAKTHLGG
ncbi:phosphotransferase family protein [Mycobacterium sp. 050134]|uniref:phosphotransferase family protein n=1 Tax=Mycobacterium sp. 050134 TaxID=3096111 RepID=UPI002ED798D8